jgi:unsaturated chondroitin disaccharide hydrolase
MSLGEIISLVATKVERTAKTTGNGFPHLTKNGRWWMTQDGGWTGGFWVGVLWLTHLMTGDEKFACLARKWLPLLERRKKDRIFDLGFLFYPSFVLGYRITGDEHLRRVALEAAETMASLSHGRSGFICQEVREEGRRLGRTCIDVMMDLPLLWWAHAEAGREEFYNTAFLHSVRTAEVLIGKDGPKIQAADIDLETGEIVRKITLHGYRHDSRWTRGMAWCIYGFTLAHHATGSNAFLDMAKGLADTFISNLPDDLVPYWDLDDPNIPNVPRDSSAAAIACSGLMALHRVSCEERFGIVARNMLDSLRANYLAGRDRDEILAGGCLDFPKEIGVNEGLVWGDYYFLESLLKAERFDILWP